MIRAFVTILFACQFILLQAQIVTLKPGQPAPSFLLKNVDGKQVSFNDYPAAKGFILVFTCNTCPYARAYEQRIILLDREYRPKGYPVIAINPNDPDLSPGDSYEKMKERARSKGYPFPYLYDEGQVVTNLYGARNTPHVFLISKKEDGNMTEYTGTIDNDPQNENLQKVKYLEQAIEALMKGGEPAIRMTKAIGCSVSRKK